MTRSLLGSWNGPAPIVSRFGDRTACVGQLEHLFQPDEALFGSHGETHEILPLAVLLPAPPIVGIAHPFRLLSMASSAAMSSSSFAPTRLPLHRDEIGNAGHAHLSGSYRNQLRTSGQLFVWDGRVDEQIDLDQWLARIVHGEHSHAPFLDPRPPLRRIGEVTSRHRSARHHADAIESRNRLDGFPGSEVHDEIHIGGESGIAVEHDRQTADDDVPGTRLVERSEDRVEGPHWRMIADGMTKTGHARWHAAFRRSRAGDGDWLASLLAVLLIGCVTSPAQAQEPALGACTDRDDAMPIGPARASLLDGDLGLARRVCPRDEIALAGTGLVLADLDDFYGHVRASAVLSASYAADEHTELFVDAELLRYETVISSINADHLGLGHLSLGAMHVLAEDDAWTFGASTRLVLPTALGLYDNTWPLGLDALALLAWQAHPRLRLRAHAGALGTIGAGAGPHAPRGAALAGAGLAYRPVDWLAFVVDADASFARTAALDHLALAPALRFAIGTSLGIELAATFPLAGRERALTAATLRLSLAL